LQGKSAYLAHLAGQEGDSGDVTLWDIVAGKRIVKFNGQPTAPISRMAFSPDGSKLVTANSRINRLDSEVPVQVQTLGDCKVARQPGS